MFVILAVEQGRSLLCSSLITKHGDCHLIESLLLWLLTLVLGHVPTNLLSGSLWQVLIIHEVVEEVSES